MQFSHYECIVFCLDIALTTLFFLITPPWVSEMKHKLKNLLQIRFYRTLNDKIYNYML